MVMIYYNFITSKSEQPDIYRLCPETE